MPDFSGTGGHGRDSLCGLNFSEYTRQWLVSPLSPGHWIERRRCPEEAVGGSRSGRVPVSTQKHHLLAQQRPTMSESPSLQPSWQAGERNQQNLLIDAWTAGFPDNMLSVTQSGKPERVGPLGAVAACRGLLQKGSASCDQATDYSRAIAPSLTHQQLTTTVEVNIKRGQR